jgi:hypothetical protein
MKKIILSTAAALTLAASTAAFAGIQGSGLMIRQLIGFPF